MAAALPQLGQSPAAAAASAAAGAAAAEAAALATAPARIEGNASAVAAPAVEAAAPAAAQAVAPAVTAAVAAAVVQPPAPPAPPPAQANPSADQNLPSPADLSAAANQGLASIPETSNLPSLDDFTATVSGGSGTRLAGVYVPGQLALPIIQQPVGDVNFVDSNDRTVTEYARSSAFNVVGLLAHNTLSSGQSFFRLKPGQDVILIYGSGRQARYRIDRIENYQALSSTDPYSDFVDLNGPGGGRVLNEELFRRIYTNAGELVFQTCFEANGDPSWGRMFVIAKPL